MPTAIHTARRTQVSPGRLSINRPASIPIFTSPAITLVSVCQAVPAADAANSSSPGPPRQATAASEGSPTSRRAPKSLLRHPCGTSETMVGYM